MFELVGVIIFGIILVSFSISVLIITIIESRDNNKWLKELDKE